MVALLSVVRGLRGMHADHHRHIRSVALSKHPHCACSDAQGIPISEVEEALTRFRDESTLARAMVVWKKGNGSARERLPLIRSCARLGKEDMVLELLLHNMDTKFLCEELFLDAIRSDKPTVRQHAIYDISLILLRCPSDTKLRVNIQALKQGASRFKMVFASIACLPHGPERENHHHFLCLCRMESHGERSTLCRHFGNPACSHATHVQHIHTGVLSTKKKK